MKLLAASHRRNPSAPVVTHVQPTKTPGLLSLSKPQHRHPTPRPPKSKPVQLSTTPSPEKPKGRASPAKDKSARSSSNVHNGHGPNRSHQPSPPPLSLPEQPALSDSDLVVANPVISNSILAKPAAPTLTAPSGRLAKRRNRASATTAPNTTSTPPPKAKRSPSPIKARPVPVPVPVSKNPRTSATMPLSRSVPVPSIRPPRTPVRRPTADREFPVCDDNDSDAEPTTPVHGHGVTWQQSNIFDSSDHDDIFGPRTAPLSSHTATARHYFPSPVPSPTPSPRHRPSHARSPSHPTDALFNMSFDSSSDNEFASGHTDDIRALFGLLPNRRRERPVSTSALKGNSKNSLYASSTFQNSPSPEALPPPSFSFPADGTTPTQ
ncbi:hypothetical protein BD410DRAFT_788023 [Rickenella mellea]|uniref:Uncharacterized protein n=1 Tax=Rickenella mellea TaxID=50990 RepID=A0A4Y7Q761_9AGAM|nr:hypothetical protein BD410DRAFT_788023 [Rickenella mellea]